MSPLQLSIAIHYHAMATDFRDGDFTAPAVNESIRTFVNNGLLQECSEDGRSYEPTERLHAFVRHLCKVPLPVVRWTFEEEPE